MSRHGTLAYIYSRVAENSSDRISTQELHCRMYAILCGYEVVAAFRDDGFSGQDNGRAGLRQLLAEVTKGTQDRVIIVSDRSRLARNIGTLAQIVREASDHNVRIEVSRPSDSSQVDADLA